jgi:hypothetical protein
MRVSEYHAKTWYIVLFVWFLLLREQIKQKLMNPSRDSIIIVRLFFLYIETGRCFRSSHVFCNNIRHSVLL